jgi:hypothetical protein
MRTGVHPFLLTVLASAPHSCTSARTVAVWPFPAAMKTGVVNPSLSVVVASAPHSCTSARTVAVWQLKAAIKTGVLP